ncbi:MAG: hypothetical protein CVU81_01095 [Euryarchaeota archaeon HGW-Euryarchaeota-1]|nr:MAG: hypothetical protein CVU81_01095 [Euryarchaeota archaeon HGW-Euryarchaeota-1]
MSKKGNKAIIGGLILILTLFLLFLFKGTLFSVIAPQPDEKYANASELGYLVASNINYGSFECKGGSSRVIQTGNVPENCGVGAYCPSVKDAVSCEVYATCNQKAKINFYANVKYCDPSCDNSCQNRKEYDIQGETLIAQGDYGVSNINNHWHTFNVFGCYYEEYYNRRWHTNYVGGSFRVTASYYELFQDGVNKAQNCSFKTANITAKDIDVFIVFDKIATPYTDVLGNNVKAKYIISADLQADMRIIKNYTSTANQKYSFSYCVKESTYVSKIYAMSEIRTKNDSKYLIPTLQMIDNVDCCPNDYTLQTANNDTYCGDDFKFHTTPKCSDSTLYGKCSTTQPLKCDNGSLVNDCETCGCKSGETCQPKYKGRMAHIMSMTTQPVYEEGTCYKEQQPPQNNQTNQTTEQTNQTTTQNNQTQQTTTITQKSTIEQIYEWILLNFQLVLIIIVLIIAILYLIFGIILAKHLKHN